MPLTQDNIRELTYRFCRVGRKFVNLAEFSKDDAIVLNRDEAGWTLQIVHRPIPHRRYPVVIDLPEDLFSREDNEDFFTDLAAIIAIKLTNSARIINSNEKRSSEQRKEISRKGNEARHKSGEE